MPARSLAFALASVLVSLARVEAATLTFSDGLFADATWAATTLQHDPSVTLYSQTQDTVLGAGNPSPYRRFGGSATGPGTVLQAHLYNPGTFSPALLGEIDSLTVSFDIGAFDTNNATFNLQFLLKQGDSFYVAPATSISVTGPPTGWFSTGAIVLGETSFNRVFGTGPSQPEFSSGGADLMFGYQSQLILTSAASEKAAGIDNWSVTVDFTPTVIPEPEVYAMLLASLGLLGFVVRMRRRK